MIQWLYLVKIWISFIGHVCVHIQGIWLEDRKRHTAKNKDKEGKYR